MRWLLLAASMLSTGCSCGASHERDDAGTDAPPALDAGTDAPPPDAPPPDAPPRDAGPICSLAAPTSDVAGTTPLGDVSFPYGWAGLGNTSKACFGLALHVTDTPDLYGPPARSLWMWLPRPSAEPILGTHTGVTVTLDLDGTTATTATGTVTVTAYTREPLDPAVEATIDVVGDGFDVHGTISVPYCDVFRDPCI